MHVCHTQKITIIGSIRDPQLTIGVLVVYLSSREDRLELYFNLSDARKIGMNWTAEKTKGLVRRVQFTGSEEYPALFDVDIGQDVT